MATLAATVPTRVGALTPGAAVAASDVVPAAALGVNGALLEILNGNASPDAMTISDSGSSAAGTPVTNYAATVTNGTNKVFKLSPKQADANGNITITHSVITTVTYKLYPLG
jgi:hypothetical protein